MTVDIEFKSSPQIPMMAKLHVYTTRNVVLYLQNVQLQLLTQMIAWVEGMAQAVVNGRNSVNTRERSLKKFKE